MKAKGLSLLILVTLILVSACSPAARTPAHVTQPPTVREYSQETAPKSEQPRPAATQAYVMPAPTSAPAPTSNFWGQPGSAGAPADNEFQNYGTNPPQYAPQDNLSTFAMDVDTASYTVARRYIMDGNLPPTDSVRVEEFVNYFETGYQPPSNDTFALYADGAPSPFGWNDTYFVRFGVKGYEVNEWERKPVSLVFVIDISGSMDMENRLGLVKRSLDLLVDRLGPEDTVGIVVFGSDARVQLEPTSGSRREEILNAIYNLSTEGSTNAEAGLRMGYRMAMHMYRRDTVNRVILCSDGVANTGDTQWDAIYKDIRGYVEEGVTLTTVGFGMGNFNDVLLEQLADHGDGHYAYVDTLEEARRLFVDDLTGTLQVIAKDAKVQVDFNTDIVIGYRQLGYENRQIADQDFRNDSVDAGELGAGHSVTAVYEVKLRPGAEGRLATFQVRWQSPDTNDIAERNINLNTWDLSRSFEEAEPHYQLAVLVAHYAEILKQSDWAKELSMKALSERVDHLRDQLPWDADVAEFSDLVRRAAQLQGWWW